jgi:hypothetical protein
VHVVHQLPETLLGDALKEAGVFPELAELGCGIIFGGEEVKPQRVLPGSFHGLTLRKFKGLVNKSERIKSRA